MSDEPKKPKPAQLKEAGAARELVEPAQPQPSPQAPLTEEKRELSSTAADPRPAQAKPAAAPAQKTGSLPPAEGAPQPAPNPLEERRSIWYSAAAALRYVGNLSRDDDVKVRDSDRATSLFLVISCVLLGVSLIVPAMAVHRIALLGVCDLLVGVVLLLYVANRFGILNTMAPRQALLSWQLIMGAGFIGIFVTANLAILLTLVASLTGQP